MKEATKKILINLDGTLNKRYVSALRSCHWDDKRKRIYPVRYSDANGNPAKIIDLRLYVIAIMKRQQYRYTIGNDKERAPRGGQVGTFYKLTPNSYNFIKSLCQ